MTGSLNPAQRAAVSAVVTGRVVTDLGAGEGSLAVRIVALGAKEVVAVDKEIVKFGTLPRIRPVISCFKNFREEIDVAFVSWPPQWGVDGLVEAASSARTIIYLGTNTDGTVCGPHAFWQLVSGRRALVHLPDRKNTLIVYSEEHDVRPALPEEKAALNMRKIYSYDELYVPRGQLGRSSDRVRAN